MYYDYYPGPCFYPPYEQCDLCGDCVERYLNSLDAPHEDDEPSDADIEQYVEEQMLAEELEVDNL